MTKRLLPAVISLGMLAFAPAVLAQEPEPLKVVPLDVQVVVSRYQGEKKISSLPFSLAVNANANETSRLRMGANVPVPATTFPPPKGNEQTPNTVMSFSYRDVGTNIDCFARSTEPGRFQLYITVEDSSVYSNTKESSIPGQGDLPVFRSFKSTNGLLLQDGQTRQFTAATDRVNGEVVKVDVTLKVVK